MGAATLSMNARRISGSSRSSSIACCSSGSGRFSIEGNHDRVSQSDNNGFTNLHLVQHLRIRNVDHLDHAVRALNRNRLVILIDAVDRDRELILTAKRRAGCLPRRCADDAFGQ